MVDKERVGRGVAVSGVANVPFELYGLRDFISEVEIRRRISHIFPPITTTLHVVYISDNVFVIVR